LSAAFVNLFLALDKSPAPRLAAMFCAAAGRVQAHATGLY
jgi:hypothetical protein